MGFTRVRTVIDGGLHIAVITHVFLQLASFVSAAVLAKLYACILSEPYWASSGRDDIGSLTT